MKLEVVSNPEVCTDCGGNCCKKQPGAAYPEDFGQTPMQMLLHMTTALATGFWCIDWWEGDPRENRDELDKAEYLRPAIVTYKGQIHHAAWGGQCILWSQRYGCSLSPVNRPRECRMLRPRTHPDGDCISADETSKQQACVEWIPYQELIGLAAYSATMIKGRMS